MPRSCSTASSTAALVQDPTLASTPSPTHSRKLVVSEHGYTGLEIPLVQEDQTEEMDDRKPAPAPAPATGITGGDGDDMSSSPAEIPPDADADGSVAIEEKDEGNNDNGEEDDDEDYEYEYDLSDDEGNYSGFIASAPPSHTLSSSSSHAAADVVPHDGEAKAEHIIEDEANDNEKPAGIDESSKCISTSEDNMEIAQFAAIQPSQQQKSKWREPSQQAVSMSLRVEKEKSGGRRRLAADLYKIMMNDTEEAGFSIEPCSEDSMNKWTIKLFKFDTDSNLHKDLMILGLDHVQLEMNFPEQYPFEPPFVRVVRPRFKRQTGFVMNGALCMELLTNEGWNPINDIESVIVSIRSLLVVGGGRLQAAVDMPEEKRQALLNKAQLDLEDGDKKKSGKRKWGDDEDDDKKEEGNPKKKAAGTSEESNDVGSYSVSEAEAAYDHLSNYHKKKGWSGWWAKKG